MSSLGLGIDCGGTYTDAAVYDLDGRQVLAAAKYPTSHHDLVSCIDGVLAKLPGDLLSAVQLASVSTTLATNSIVEGKGGRACLILIGYAEDMWVNGYGSRVARVRGGHDCRGDQVDDLDEAGVLEAVRQHRDWADAFAISSYFSVRNPEHELRAARIVAAETGKPIVCGHELSMHLDAPKRATTAAINARLIPLITDLIASAQTVLAARSIKAPLMIVRGDGTLMGVETAGQRPVETILSGPAASVVGALALTGRADGVVIDVGGTTTDIAGVEGGLPRINQAGATVGGLATQVEAIDIRTMGLGGDSLIRFGRNGKLEIGPRRVLPIGMLPGAEGVAETLEALPGSGLLGRAHELMSFWTVPPGKKISAEAEGNGWVQRAVQAPLSYLGLKEEEIEPDALKTVHRLEQGEELLLAALTPTDIFNYTGETAVGDIELSRRAVETAAALLKMDPAELAAMVKEDCREIIVHELLAHLLGVNGGGKGLLDAWSRGDSVQGVRLCLNLETDILAVGAPAGVFLLPVAERLGCGCVTPPFMEVANAVGAVAGVVSHTEEVIIRRRIDGHYTAHASDGRYDFDELVEATALARSKASELASAIARATGAGEVELHEHIDEFTATSHWDQPVVLERTVRVRAVGRPRLA